MSYTILDFNCYENIDKICYLKDFLVYDIRAYK